MIDVELALRADYTELIRRRQAAAGGSRCGHRGDYYDEFGNSA